MADSGAGLPEPVSDRTFTAGDDARHRRQQQALVMLTGADVLASGDLLAAFRRITEIDAETLDVARSSIWRYNEDRSAIVCADLFDRTTGTHASGLELRAADYPAYFAALDAMRVIDAADARTDPRTSEFTENYLAPLGITSMMDAPIHVGAVVDGVICREHVGEPRRWTGDEVTFGVAVANLTSLAVAGWQQRMADTTARLQVAALNAAANAMVITSRDGSVEWVNPAFTKATGYTLDEAVGRNPRDLVKSGLHDSAHYRQLWDALLAGRVWRGEMTNRRKDGSLYPVELTITPIPDEDGAIGHFIAVQRDLTEEKRLEAQFLQAQKMEVVGRLAGGIAHDFNNLLTVINGTADIAAMGLDRDHPLRADLEQIQQAGRRAASLTRQLLTFSRRQVVSAEVIDLGRMVADWRGMLQRLVGETVTLDVSVGPDTGKVKADPGQIEQVIMNLAVNARDAMPDGGRLTIETRAVDLDDAFAATHLGVKPGPYAVLIVSDTGVGMDADTKARIFEPFFTTKEPGKGTGLGLATAFGIIQSAGGSIWVYSEPGRGSTFKIYLPRVAGAERRAEVRPKALVRGDETVALVEDEGPLRSLASRILTSAGYKVLAAPTPTDALHLVQSHQGPLHLLFTDVVLPGMNGRELASRMLSLRPHIAVLFTSGYTDDEILRHGVLDRATHFISKPYTAADLTHMVRHVLDARPRP